MLLGQESEKLQLTEEEAYALLSLCMMSEEKLSVTSEKALKKLADYCRIHTNLESNHDKPDSCELYEAG